MMADLPQAYHMLNRAMASNSGGGGDQLNDDDDDDDDGGMVEWCEW